MARDDSDCGIRFEELCSDLNLDPVTKEEALNEYYRIKENYSLEGDPVHWVACALYEACRKQIVPTVENGEMEGNGVSLTRLLRTAKFSLIQFFNKIKKWADMANLPQNFRDRIDHLERNFSVATVIYKKYKPIFVSVFKDPSDNEPKPSRSRKQRPKPCTTAEVYDFIWRMFVLTKGNYPNISDDLVNSYHLLLCVVDWVYINAVLGGRHNLINDHFDGGIHNTAAAVPCIIGKLCREHDGIEVEAKGIKEHYFKNYVKKLTEKGLLRGTFLEETLTGVFDINYFNENSKSIDKAYEEYVLTIGDFDERIFLSKDADHEIGTPAKQPSSIPSTLDGPSLLLEAAARSNADAKLQEYLESAKSLCPKTPLTGRHHLPESHTEVNATPISMATKGVNKLHTLLSGVKKDELSDNLAKLFKECTEDPTNSIKERLKTMGERFCDVYTMPCDKTPSHIDFSQNRLQYATTMYYKVLESIMVEEQKKLEKRAPGQPIDLSGLLGQDIFHRSLFACCLEVVMFCYNSQRTFPWVVAVYDLQPYDFYKVIELLIRAEEGFSRDVIKHLNSIEESILDCMAWRSDSTLWNHIDANKESLPKSDEVSLQQQQQSNHQIVTTQQQQHSLSSPLNSPIAHPQIRRLAMSDGKLVTKKQGDVTVFTPSHSPNRAPLATDRFNSPVTSSARRRLFPALSSSSSQPTVTASDGHSPAVKQHIITFQQASTDDGKQILIPVQIVQNVNQSSGETSKDNNSTSAVNTAIKNGVKPVGNKAKKTGSLALFFRKVYHLASVRIKDLCDRLGADDQLRRRIWTTFEHCLVSEIDLMRDRRLDQFIMCAVYSICKISGRDYSFQDIMKCYRLQPQAQSHVYRSVLLNRLHLSQTSSQSTQQTLSQSSSDSNCSSDHISIQHKLNSLRSSSTLPFSQGSSQPPTPTRPSGSSSVVYENEERGDLIKFYNTVYVRHMKDFILRFQSSEVRAEPSLSALPSVRPLPTSPRRVSNQHSVYISPHKKPTLNPLTPNSRLLYCFNSSPAKDLRAINNMLRLGDKRPNSSCSLAADKKQTTSTADVIESGGGPAIKHIKF